MDNANICKLCEVNVADKRNSHIIPKFLGKKLFEGVLPRQALEIHPSGKQKKVQDTSKEDFIFCSDCEQRFEIIETLVSKNLHNLSDYLNYSNFFELKKIDNQEYIECKKIKSNELIIFIYSVLWRISISNLEAFVNLKMDLATEKTIQEVLNKTLSKYKKDLENKIDALELIDVHTICLMKIKDKFLEGHGIQTCMKLSDSLYHVYMDEIFVVFYSNKNNVHFSHQHFKLSTKSKPLIPVANFNSWNKLMNSISLPHWFVYHESE